jgi:hypothetical protein
VFRERLRRPRVADDFAVGAEALDFDLLTPELVLNRLDVVGANLLEPDFLDDSRRFVDERVLGSLDDLDCAVCPSALRMAVARCVKRRALMPAT